MESEIEQTHIISDYFDKQKFQKQLDIIKQASELAQEKIDYFSAHDGNIRRAIDVVEDFLRKKHRLCYGGQAINAHLPAKYKFYDPEYSIPDYDFFTPQQATDISTLVRDLRKAGFTEISAREGMHEGTVKIYVDYIPVADMTAIDPKLYRILSKREYRVDGISYLDANTLRMLMYLELSRPRGEVSRWGKVFERLALFNAFVPGKSCRVSRNVPPLAGLKQANGHRNTFKGGLNSEQVKYVLNYIIEKKRVFAGADLIQFYQSTLKQGKQNANWILTSKKPILFFSPNSDEDAKAIRNELSFINSEKQKEEGVESKKQITIKSFSSRGVDLLPSMKVIVQANKPLVFVIDQSACHSYFNIPINDGKIMRIASMDTLITLYFSLGLLDTKYLDMGSMECLANELVNISNKARNEPDKFGFPFISIKCAGHQTSLPSLIRSKVRRVTQKKQQLKELLEDRAIKKSNIGRRSTIKRSFNIKRILGDGL